MYTQAFTEPRKRVLDPLGLELHVAIYEVGKPNSSPAQEQQVLWTGLVSNSLCNPGWPQSCSLPVPVGEHLPSSCETLDSALSPTRIQKTGTSNSLDFLLIICTRVEVSLNVLEATFTEPRRGDDPGHLEFQVLVNKQAAMLCVQSDT